MKIDQVFIYYLLKHKELPLQGIGVFRLQGTITEPSDPSKPFVIPSDAISFEYNPRTAEDPNLVSFISETTGKIKPLASADLDSYLMLGRQFLNIGKPLIIPNMGTVEKIGNNDLTFKGGQYAMERLTPVATHHDVEEAEPTEDESFSDFPRKRNSGKSMLYIILLIILGFIAWAVWRYAFDHPEEATVTHTDIQPVPDTPAPPVDTTKKVTDSIPKTDTMGFQVVVGVYNSITKAQNRLTDLKKSNKNVIMYTLDSAIYKIAEQFDLPLRDTNKIMGPLRLYYGPGRPYTIEKINTP